MDNYKAAATDIKDKRMEMENYHGICFVLGFF